jgi:hypothetical protein
MTKCDMTPDDAAERRAENYKRIKAGYVTQADRYAVKRLTHLRNLKVVLTAEQEEFLAAVNAILGK